LLDLGLDQAKVGRGNRVLEFLQLSDQLGRQEVTPGAQYLAQLDKRWPQIFNRHPHPLGLLVTPEVAHSLKQCWHGSPQPAVGMRGWQAIGCTMHPASPNGLPLAGPTTTTTRYYT